jgi:hypothetical protein
VTIALAEAADAVDGEFLFTLKANAGPGGKSKNILGLDVLPGTGILGARGAAPPKKTGDRAARNGVRSSRLYPRAHRFSHPPIINLLTSASGLSPDRQKDSL